VTNISITSVRREVKEFVMRRLDKPRWFSFILFSLLLAGCGGTSTPAVSEVSIGNAPTAAIQVGQEVQLSVSVMVAGANNTTDFLAITWKSSDESVASISATGLLRALKVGTTTITATSEKDGSKSASFVLTVTETTSPPPPSTPSAPLPVSALNLELASETTSISRGQQGAVGIALTRTNVSDPVTLEVTGAPEGVTASFGENPLTGNATTLTLAVAGTATKGSYPLEVRASAGTFSDTATLTLEVTLAPINIDTVVLQDLGSSTQVRQGYGALTVNITGQNLAGISSATLGAFEGTVASNTNTAASLTFTIPSGAVIGARDLSITTTNGTVSKADAVTVTAITAGPSGDDSTGKGTPDQPFKALTKSVEVSGENDTVQLLDGTYTEAYPVTIPANRVIKGTSKVGTILQSNSKVDGLIFQGSAKISDLSLTGFSAGLSASAGMLTIADMSVTSSDNGMVLSGALTATVTNSQFDTNGTGIYFDGLGKSENSKLFVTKSSFSNSYAGIYSYSSEVTVKDSTFDDNDNGIAFLNNFSKASLTVTESIFRENLDGIYSHSNWPSGGSVNINVTNSTFSANKRGVNVHGGYWTTNSTVNISGVTIEKSQDKGLEILYSSLKMRNTTISNTTLPSDGLPEYGHGAGLYISGNSYTSTFDLGTASDPGNNSFINNQGYQLYDNRAALQDANGTIITAFGTTLSGGQPTGIKTGVDEEIASDGTLVWRIAGQNQRIQFSE
jgi:hypothetical protein